MPTSTGTGWELHSEGFQRASLLIAMYGQIAVLLLLLFCILYLETEDCQFKGTLQSWTFE